MRKVMLLFVALALVPWAASAQTGCESFNTIGQCFDAVKDAHPPVPPEIDQAVAEADKAKAKATADAELASAEDNETKVAKAEAVEQDKRSQPKIDRKATGTTAPGTAFGSATQDFLSQLFAALQSAQLDPQKQELVVAYNLPWKSHGVAVQLESVLHQPVLYKALKDKLTSAGDTQEISQLEGQLNDASFMLSFSRESSRFGRTFSSYRPQFEQLFKAALAKGRAAAKGTDLARQRLNALEQEIIQKRPSLSPEQRDNPDSIPLSALGTDRDRVVAAIVAAAATEVRLENAKSKILKDYQLPAFADLVADQPQLTVTLGGRFRDRTVGPDEVTGEASFEIGSFNLNGACPQGTCDLEQYKSYVDKYAKGHRGQSDQLRTTDDRLKISVNYSRSRAYALTLPADSIDLHLPRVQHWSVDLTYGRQVVFDSTDKAIGRIDLTGRYENYSDDPLHQDRGTLDLTYTHTVNDSFQLPLGITYANHGEFLGDVDRRLSAHFGLHAKIFK